MTSLADIEYSPDPSMVVEIVGDVFAGLFGERYERPFPASPDGELVVSARVSVSGGWYGDVVVSCSEPLARRAAAELFAVPSDDVADDDVRDVIGEFANVIGGNVKSVMPGPSALSLPSTSLDGPIDRPGEVEALRLDLAWQNEPLRVSIWATPADRPTKENQS